VEYKNPTPVVDMIVELEGSTKDFPRIVLIQRKNPPYGLAIPGGYVDEGEALWEAAKREALEELNIGINIKELFHVYSNPDRDPRSHNVSTVFLAKAMGFPVAGDDAAEVVTVELSEGFLQQATLAFDHKQILQDYLFYRRTGTRPSPKT
jgi:8-oxo-dGTP diphosphatase